jgi:hypothetical protein
MTLDYYHHKIGILERHCEKVGRDPAEIKRTILMPVMVTDDKAAAANFITSRSLGVGTAAGPKAYIIERIGEFVEAGVDEIMFAGLVTSEIEQYQRFEEEILAAFD